MNINRNDSLIVVRYNKILHTKTFFEGIKNKSSFYSSIFTEELNILNNEQKNFEDTYFGQSKMFNLDDLKFPQSEIVVNLNHIVFCDKDGIDFRTSGQKCRMPMNTKRLFLLVFMVNDICLIIEIRKEDSDLSLEDIVVKYLINCSNEYKKE